MQWLNAFPPQLGETIFSIAKAFKPTVSISRIVRYVEHKPAMSGDIYILSDWQLDNRFFSFFKRLADILLSLVLSVIMAVPMLMIALMIKLYDGGPILFRQIRVGRNKRLFTCFKFRTMKQNTGDHPTHEIHVDRITRVGHWLRSTKLDELPQLWNVFRSDMSFIGPRPCLPTQKELINERQRLGVFAVKPGISGYAQTRNIDMSTPSKLAYLDQQYAARQSILLDIELMFSTAARLFRDR